MLVAVVGVVVVVVVLAIVVEVVIAANIRSTPVVVVVLVEPIDGGATSKVIGSRSNSEWNVRSSSTNYIKTLAELHGDLFSRHACPLEGDVVFVVAVDETIVNVINDPTKGRASPRSNYNDQQPRAEGPMCATTRVSVD